MRPARFPIAASRGSVTSFPGLRCGGVICPRERSTLAGNGDVFAAAGVVAVVARLSRDRTGDFIGVYTPIGRRLGEVPRLAVGARGGGAALLALGQALVDAVAVRLVGNDEDAAISRCGRCRRC